MDDLDDQAALHIRTMEEFSAYVGLSRPTVSKYFNEPTAVRAKTRSRIEAAIEESGFQPNLFAANLKRRQSRVIGVIIPDSKDPFYMGLTARIEEIADAHGYFSFVASSRGQPGAEAEAIRRLQSIDVAGAIIVPLLGDKNEAELARLESRVPLIYVDSPPGHDAAFIGTNHDQSISISIDYLCRTGAPPAYLSMPEINRNARARAISYEKAMEARALEPKFIELPDEVTWDFERVGHAALAKYLGKGARLDTLLCANDRIAFGAVLASWEAGLTIGPTGEADLRIVGHDDHPLSRYLCPPLTTVAQNYLQIAELATETLISSLKSGAPPKNETRLLNAALVQRRSA